MPTSPAHTVTLCRHPETPAPAVSVSVRITRDADGMLAVSYVIAGDLDRLHVPAPRAPSERDRPGIALQLWKHTCCEIFIARAGLPGYHEFNFSPSGAWAAYAFERYREGAPLAGEAHARTLDPGVTVRRAPARLELDVVIRLDSLSPAHAAAPLAIALAAVLEDTDGALSYWALKHPPGRPDFHHADGYVLELAGTGSSARAPA